MIRPIKIPEMLLARLIFWLHMLKSIVPVSWRVAVGMVLSLFYDIPMYLIRRQNLLMLVGGVIFLKKHNLYFNVRSMTEDLYYVIPRREGVIEDFILNTLNDGDLFIDVGANIGYYTILAAKKVGTKGVVVAIEPVAETAKILKFNLRLNNIGNVIVVNKAAWKRFEKIRIHIPIFHGGQFYGLSTALSCPNTMRSRIDKVVDGVTLDSLAQSFDSVRLIKIDVEGAEDAVLLGAINSLKKTSHIYVECSKENEAKVLKLLNENRFTCEIINVPHAMHMLCKRISRGLNEHAEE